LIIKSIMLPLTQLKDVGGITALESALNERLRNASPSNVVFSTIGATLAFAYVYSQLTHRYPWFSRLKHEIFRHVRKLPFVKKQIEEETSKVQVDLEKEFLKYCTEVDNYEKLPKQE